jgi:hypothetical protein
LILIIKFIYKFLLGINPDRSYPTIELEFPSYKYQVATLSPRNGLAMQAQTKNEQLLRSCAFQDDVKLINHIKNDLNCLFFCLI